MRKLSIHHTHSHLLIDNRDKTSTVVIKPYTRKELADLYGVCSRTLAKWIKPFEAEVGPLKGRFYSIPQIKIIFKHLSTPSFLDTDYQDAA